MQYWNSETLEWLYTWKVWKIRTYRFRFGGAFLMFPFPDLSLFCLFLWINDLWKCVTSPKRLCCHLGFFEHYTLFVWVQIHKGMTQWCSQPSFGLHGRGALAQVHLLLELQSQTALQKRASCSLSHGVTWCFFLHKTFCSFNTQDDVSRGAGEAVVRRCHAFLLVEGARGAMIKEAGCMERKFGLGSDVAGEALDPAGKIVRTVDKTQLLAWLFSPMHILLQTYTCTRSPKGLPPPVRLFWHVSTWIILWWTSLEAHEETINWLLDRHGRCAAVKA